MYIIGICGRMGSGKDFIATQLHTLFTQRNKKVCILGVADALKCVGVLEHGFTEQEMSQKPLHVREWLQAYGTMKRQTDPHYWVNGWMVHLSLAAQRGYQIAIAPDIRFQEETEMVDMLIRIHAPKRHAAYLKASGHESRSHHVSETQQLTHPNMIEVQNDISTDNNLEVQLVNIASSVY